MVKEEMAMLEVFHLTPSDGSGLASPFRHHNNNDVSFEHAISKAKRRFEKRRGPTLIKPLNKKQNRVVVGDMEFDPVSLTWKGNDDELSGFPRGVAPALISNMGRHEDSMVIGNMRWDPKLQEWRGNEADLLRFRTPGLITPLNGGVLDTKVQNGMVLDPVTMKWRGNEDDLDVFEAMDDQNNDNTFKEEGEFNITEALLQSFYECQNKHAMDLGGWFPESRDLDDREHLGAIRQMSISKLIQNTTSSSSSNSSMIPTIDDNGQVVPCSNNNVLPMLLKKKKKKVVDETNEWDDVDFEGPQPKLQLKLNPHIDATTHESSATNEESNWDKEMGFASDDETSSSSGTGSHKHTPRNKLEEWSDFGSFDSAKLERFRESEEALDDDDLDWSSLGSRKPLAKRHIGLKTLSGGSLSKTYRSAEKTGSLNLRQGSSTLNNIPPLTSPNLSPVQSSATSTPNMMEECFDDLDIEGPLALKHRLHNDDFQTLSADEPWSIHDQKPEALLPGVCREVLEEEWPEVIIPPGLCVMKPNDVNRRLLPHFTRLAIEDYSSDFMLPNNGESTKLIFKPYQLVDDPFGDDDDEGWDDINFPDNFHVGVGVTTSTSTAPQSSTVHHVTTSNNNNYY
ncbi:hypothetical protein SAMD00019534_087010 [Acytostelium subglobosum LB1]|uniref:hypothetical protein n=1 Tax=Acytostelium subglobosum LB1 TaxID=1410327 RepID=UPI000644EEF0|nr:hypothetical protein SAMD00019534_087010 [Acytostelium subglobosum LB1]GAM25526.1 hypothetical protein SAMD00019534_087010 [Acytostelium subglobosum LB1]|eukprot:XP_012751512.1 hypothetical protein SAMD00019534_087010 [Acytostelium subglobosum LB1]